MQFFVVVFLFYTEFRLCYDKQYSPQEEENGDLNLNEKEWKYKVEFKLSDEKESMLP